MGIMGISASFIQGTCAHKAQEKSVVINLKALQDDPVITSVTSTGAIVVTTTKSGVESVQNFPALTATALSIEADADAAIQIEALGLVINTLGDQVELVTE